MRVLLIILGLIIGTVGGVIAYRAWFIDPPSAIVITDTAVRERQNYLKIGGGLVLLGIGAAVAIAAARPKKVS